ncbi:MAG: complex I NDUFA9 subunit family protein [Betaproteobacteria bacterium]
MNGAPIVVVGGSGFVGRHLVSRLVAAGKRVVVPTRSRERARHLILLPTVDVVEADVHDPAALAALVRGAAAAINLVGILNESRPGDFVRIHVELPRKLIAACHDGAVPRLLHMSALNADPQGPSNYLRSKGEAESLVAASGLQWTIFQPSIIVGREDSFLNLFAKLQRMLPVIALACAGARFQPVGVADVASAYVRALAEDETHGRRYPLCGPKVYTLRQLVAYVGELTGYRRPIVALGPGLSKLQARVLEMLPGKLMSRDNLASMQRDNVCDCAFPRLLGGPPAALEAIAPAYIAAAAPGSRYDRLRSQRGG